MEQRLSMITLGVTDLETSKQFYEQVVGWNSAHGPDGIAFFDLGGTVLSLYPHADLIKDMSPGESSSSISAYHGFALAHNARSKEEVDAIFSRLKAKGARIIKEPKEVFWGGYSGYFSDPDGHPWEVAFNPFWSILEDGRISMGV